MFKNIFSYYKAVLEELENPTFSKKIGNGWLSGAVSLVISILALVLVLCLLFPNILRVPEIQEKLTPNIIRLVLHLMIIAGFVFASVSMILREAKILGFVSIVIIFITMALGTVSVKEELASTSRIYFGLDWFVLNLVLTGIIFLPLEKLFHRTKQSVFRSEWRTDSLYFFIGSIFVQGLTYLSLLPSKFILETVPLQGIQAFIKDLNLAVQLVLLMFLTDLIQYWVHRLFHRIPHLWYFHAIHHCAKILDWIAGSRMHVLEIIVLRGATVIPMYVLGFSQTVIFDYCFYLCNLSSCKSKV